MQVEKLAARHRPFADLSLVRISGSLPPNYRATPFCSQPAAAVGRFNARADCSEIRDCDSRRNERFARLQDCRPLAGATIRRQPRGTRDFGARGPQPQIRAHNRGGGLQLAAFCRRSLINAYRRCKSQRVW